MMKKGDVHMQPKTRFRPTALTALLLLCLTGTGVAEEQSGCVTCHLDETMLVKNLSTDKVKTSALQSGAG